MTNRDQQIQDHAVWNRLTSAESAADQAEGRLDDSSTGALENLERVRSVLRYARRVLERVNNDLLTLSQFNSIDQALQQVVQETNNYASNGNEQHLGNASNHADSLLAQLSGVPVVSSPEDVGQLREDIASFRKSASALLRGLESDVDSLRQVQQETRAKNDDLASDIKEQKSRLDNVISTAQTQVQELVSSTQNQASETLSRLQQQFSEAQDRRSAEFETQIREALEEIEAAAQAAKDSTNQLIQDFEAKLEDQASEVESRAESLMQALETQLNEAKRIVNVVGNIGMTGDYQMNANRQRSRADLLQGLAVLLFVGAAVLAVYLFGNSSAASLDLAQSIRRAAILAFAITPAWVTLRLSRGHRSVEDRYRSIELELASLNPYLALLPEQLQQAVKSELASRYFGGTDAHGEPLEVEPWLQRIASIARRRNQESAAGEQ